MFNRTTINRTNVDNSINYPDRIEIIEKRAPTDASIKLLNEMREKSLDNIVAKIQVINNEFKFDFIAFQNNLPLDTTSMYFKFKLNGIDYQFEKKYDWETKEELFKFTNNIRHLVYNEKYYDSSKLIREIIIDFISKIIAEGLVKDYNFMKSIECICGLKK